MKEIWVTSRRVLNLDSDFDSIFSTSWLGRHQVEVVRYVNWWSDWRLEESTCISKIALSDTIPYNKIHPSCTRMRLWLHWL